MVPRLGLVALVGLLLGCGSESSGPDDDGAGIATGVGDESGQGEAVPCFETPLCDPLAPACQGEASCVPNGNAFECIAPIEGAEQAGLGDACEGGLSCQAGLVCLPVAVSGCTGAPGCCVAVCDLDVPQCAGGFSCSPFFTDVTVSCYDTVGVCLEG